MPRAKRHRGHRGGWKSIQDTPGGKVLINYNHLNLYTPRLLYIYIHINRDLDTALWTWILTHKIFSGINGNHLAKPSVWDILLLAVGQFFSEIKNPCNYIGWALAFQLLPMTHGTKGRSPFQLQSSWHLFWFSTWLLLKIYTVRKTNRLWVVELCVCLFFQVQSSISWLRVVRRSKTMYIMSLGMLKYSEWYSIEFIQYIRIMFCSRHSSDSNPKNMLERRHLKSSILVLLEARWTFRNKYEFFHLCRVLNTYINI